ncbi:hypothetical protein SF1_32510 [Sphingobacterium faecium NBRC 15299]|uniref:hypothetical protein n=1 Tax=Sphingobacterium faecium TaxID=34087 RepID=UPI000D39981F|nr:hypothetical protein [Sphingobacterium faecium]PTX13575.1 hypothetical protein C8N37_101321 [Sphingobacterium faecium]GEM65269.1 hypothetical protein SF1_32510 [Sphingobacterium faecium NBRC 15299]
MTIIEDLTEWLKCQNVGWRDTALYQVLYLDPSFDITKYNDIFEDFKKYFNCESETSKKIGKLIYLIGAIDFAVRDWDSIDNLIDSQNIMQSTIDSGESEGRNMVNLKNLHSLGNERFEERKEFKNNWCDYRDSNLNFDILAQALRLSYLDKS